MSECPERSPGAPLLAARNLGIEVEGRRLFQALELELRAGELLGLTGPSGAGKTTLLRILAGLIDPAEGSLTLRGRAPAEIGWPCYRRQVTLLAQKPVFIEASVAENLRRPFSYRSSRGAFPEPRARSLLGQLGLSQACLDQMAGSLSVGEQQRVALLRALLVEPAVLLLDEPTSALDEQSTARVEGLLAELAGVGLAAIIVSHDRAQRDRLCHRAMELAR